MSDPLNTLDFLIRQIITVINTSKNTEELLLVTRAGSAALDSGTILGDIETLKSRVQRLETETVYTGTTIEVIEDIIVSFNELLPKTESFTDIVLLAKSFRSLMIVILDLIIMDDESDSKDKIDKIKAETASITDAIVLRLTELLEILSTGEDAYMASVALSTMDNLERYITGTENHYKTIEQVEVRVDSLENNLTSQIELLNNNLVILTEHINQNSKSINDHVGNKNNPHDVSINLLGLDDVLRGYKSTIINQSDDNFYHPTSITSQISDRAELGITDAPSDGNSYLRKSNNWHIYTEPSSGEITPIGTILSYMGKYMPEGFIIMAGQSFSTDSFPDLTKHIIDNDMNWINEEEGKVYVPDARGLFLRGSGRNQSSAKMVHDPDGLRDLGEYQADAAIRVTGDMLKIAETWGSGGGIANGCFKKLGGYNSSNTPSSVDWSNAGGVTFDNDLVVNTSTETRPKNLAVNWILKAYYI